MDFDHAEYMKVVEACDDFDSRASDRLQMGVSQFQWALPGAGELAHVASAGSTNDYADGSAPMMHQWQFVGGGWKPGGEAHPKVTAYSKKYGAARKSWNTAVSTRRDGPPRRDQPLLPGSVLPPPEGGGTAGMTDSMADQMRMLYRDRLQKWEDTVVENGWGEAPGEAAGVTGGAGLKTPAGLAQLGVTFRDDSERAVINTLQKEAAIPPAVQAVTEQLFAAEKDAANPATLPAAKAALQSALKNVNAFAVAPPDVLKKWRELMKSMKSKTADAAMLNFIAAFDEIVRVNNLYATHGMRRTDRMDLVGRLLRELQVKDTSTPAATTAALTAAAAQVINNHYNITNNYNGTTPGRTDDLLGNSRRAMRTDVDEEEATDNEEYASAQEEDTEMEGNEAEPPEIRLNEEQRRRFALAYDEIALNEADKVRNKTIFSIVAAQFERDSPTPETAARRIEGLLGALAEIDSVEGRSQKLLTIPSTRTPAAATTRSPAATTAATLSPAAEKTIAVLEQIGALSDVPASEEKTQQIIALMATAPTSPTTKRGLFNIANNVLQEIGSPPLQENVLNKTVSKVAELAIGQIKRAINTPAVPRRGLIPRNTNTASRNLQDTFGTPRGPGTAR